MKKLLLALIMGICMMLSVSSWAYSFAQRTEDTLREGNTDSVGLGDTWKE